MNVVYAEFGIRPEDRLVVEQDTAVFYSLLDAFRNGAQPPLYFYGSAEGQLSSEARPSTITPEYYHYTMFEGKTLAEWAREDLKSIARLNPFGNIISMFAQMIGLKSQQESIEKSIELNQLRVALLITSNDKTFGAVEDVYRCLANTSYFVPCIEILPDYPTELQDNVFAHFDAFIFVPSSSTNNYPIAQWKSIFAFYSILVGLELEDPFLASKHVILYDPDNTNFKMERDFYTSLYNNGMSCQSPEDMFFVASSLSKVIECLQSARKVYRRQTLPIYEREPVNFSDKNGKFNVALYLSASSENSEYLHFTRQLAYELANRKFGIVSGGAAQGPMGAIHDALTPTLFEEMELLGSPIANIGIYTRETKLREGIPQDKLTWAYQASDVYYRMQLMEQYSDAFIILPGGKGIMQEISKLMIAKYNNHQTNIHLNYAEQLLRQSGLPCLIELVIRNNAPWAIIDPNQQQVREECSKVEIRQVVVPWTELTTLVTVFTIIVSVSQCLFLAVDIILTLIHSPNLTDFVQWIIGLHFENVFMPHSKELHPLLALHLLSSTIEADKKQTVVVERTFAGKSSFIEYINIEIVELDYVQHCISIIP
ncbi:unnamed protein product [Rotaria sp. Silwood2]|nr:unnamed protein product [Rotaria sp. Silwood2]